MMGHLLGSIVFATLTATGTPISTAQSRQPTPIKVGYGPLGASITYKLSGSTPGSRTPGSTPSGSTPAGPAAPASRPRPTLAEPAAVVTPSPNAAPTATTPTTQATVQAASPPPSTVPPGCDFHFGMYSLPIAGQVLPVYGSAPCTHPTTPTTTAPTTTAPTTTAPATSAPTTSAPPKPNVPYPSAVAASYWTQAGANQLPHPHPYIAPGYALAGLRGYLEVRAPLTATFSDSTVLGTLTIHATAVVWVNWGDGAANDGPFHTSGGPFPSGTITHYWDFDGSYDVVVDEDWSATWDLNGTSGTLSGLQTEGTIAKFEVGQLESVRNY